MPVHPVPMRLMLLGGFSSCKSSICDVRCWGLAGCLFRPLVSVLVASLTLCLVGCRRDGETSAQRSTSVAAPQAPTFARLAAAAQREGRDRIETDQIVRDQDLQVLAQTPTIKTLICDAGELTDAAMEPIAAMPQLRHLRLRHSAITDDGFRQLAEIGTLWFLNLPHCKCTADGIDHLAALPELRSLRIGSDRLEADAAKSIAAIKTLTSVHLIGVPIDDEGLKLIATLPQLESLYLDDSDVTADGWQWLFENHRSLHVHVDQRHHDRDPNQHESH